MILYTLTYVYTYEYTQTHTHTEQSLRCPLMGVVLARGHFPAGVTG